MAVLGAPGRQPSSNASRMLFSSRTYHSRVDFVVVVLGELAALKQAPIICSIYSSWQSRDFRVSLPPGCEPQLLSVAADSHFTAESRPSVVIAFSEQSAKM